MPNCTQGEQRRHTLSAVATISLLGHAAAHKA
jgi:hypothetical protein